MIEPEEQLKLIIIDDNPDWCEIVEDMVQLLGHEVVSVNSFEAARIKIKEADEAGKPYTTAILDMIYETGKSGAKANKGDGITQWIKKNYPYIGCVMITGETITPDEVLDLRDIFYLDYFLQKDRIKLENLRKAINRACQRTNPAGTLDGHRRILQESLDRLCGIRIIWMNNLSHAEEREAMQSINVDSETMQEIGRCKFRIAEIEEQIKQVEAEMARLPEQK